LIAAARAMLASDTAAQASIQEITEAADVGFGSFYNYFSSKAELFEAAVADVLDELGALLDQLSVDVDDPALAFARSARLALRLCRNRPEMAAVLIRHGMHYMESPRGLAPRALRDLQAGIAAGRFQATEPRLARAAVAGALLATLQMALTEPALVDDAAIDHLAEQVLRMLGTPYDEAHALAHAPLPVAELPEPVDRQS
jgi:AcrR family transcriptional regulator